MGKMVACRKTDAADAAMAQGIFSSLLAHGVAANAHLGENEVGVGESGLLIGGDRQLDVQAEVLVQDPSTSTPTLRWRSSLMSYRRISSTSSSSLRSARWT